MRANRLQRANFTVSCLVYSSLLLLSAAATADELVKQLQDTPHRIVFETWQNDNWELVAANADPLANGVLRGQQFARPEFGQNRYRGLCLAVCADEYTSRQHIAGHQIEPVGGGSHHTQLHGPFAQTRVFANDLGRGSTLNVSEAAANPSLVLVGQAVQLPVKMRP